MEKKNYKNGKYRKNFLKQRKTEYIYLGHNLQFEHIIKW